ncbi:MAG: hypothetical protein ACREUZ_09150 [Burkholderiales bacterium]
MLAVVFEAEVEEHALHEVEHRGADEQLLPFLGCRRGQPEEGRIHEPEIRLAAQALEQRVVLLGVTAEMLLDRRARRIPVVAQIVEALRHGPVS